MSPSAIAAKDTSSINSADNKALANIKANPFNITLDPSLLKNDNYTSAITIINQAVFSISSKIFSYESIGDADLLDSHLQLWIKQYSRKNALGVVPFYYKSQVRNGAGNAILGYLDQQTLDPVSVLVDASGLKAMYPTLSEFKNETLPLALNVSAIDYDATTNSLISNYDKVLNTARSLNYPVLNATNLNDGLEYQHLTVLNYYITKLTNKPSINVFDGSESIRNFTRFDNLLSVEELGVLYQNLLKDSDISSFETTEEIVNYAFDKLSAVTGVDYAPFEYVGHTRPDTVFITYGSNESTKLANVVDKVSTSLKIGLVKVRVPLPFSFNDFISVVPKTAAKLVVLSGQTESGISIQADISTSLFVNGMYHRFDIEEFKYPLNFEWTPITITKILNEFVENLDPKLVLEAPDSIISSSSTQITANSSPEGSYLVWGKDNGDFLSSSNKLSFSLSLDDSKKITNRTKFDNSVGGGLFQAQITSVPRATVNNQVDNADIALVDDVSLLSEYDVLATLKPTGTLLVGYYKKFDQEAFLDKLSNEFKRGLAANRNNLIVMDFESLEGLTELNDSTKGFSAEFLIQYSFWSVALPELKGFIVNKLLQANGNGFELLASVLDKFIATVEEQKLLKVIPFDSKWIDLETDEEDVEALPFFPTETSFKPNPRISNEEVEETVHSTKLDLAKKLTFKEAYETTTELRPDLPVKNFVVKVQENIRLTPDEYSRNIFHIEFDISGTGLTYDIGEALGIHGRNHPSDVEEFIEFYGVDGDSLIEVTNKDVPTLLETRSIRQALTETVDFLGKPPKRFYEALAEIATDEKEKASLNKLSSSEGAADLKKRQEVDFSTYFDILEEFKSCRPPIQDLIKIISPLKRREYSIASSQKIHPNAVHLLIVVVDWSDSKGRKRWGHCSKYLSDLRIGDELVVSVKPSVMKLPPLSEQPIVMSGLGTGLAPFKAFIEEKIWQQQQGMKIGEIFLYMGSRHKKEEYLYGELWEAYKDAGILTHIGAAFSRDQPEKIYIQDKIRESIEDLTDAIVEKNGSFYLCGPTWPVPDITACLEDIIQNAAKKRGETIKDLTKAIEDMKEEGRYILEVY